MNETPEKTPEEVGSSDLLAGAVAPLHPSTFGHYFWPDWPEYAEAAILCIVGRGGIVPLRVILQHQCYLKNIPKLLEKHPDMEEVVLVPINSDDYKSVWSKKGYSYGS